nr:hypothetical protein RVX_2788 [Nitratidesulfovibrio sp. HK-II]
MASGADLRRDFYDVDGPDAAGRTGEKGCGQGRHVLRLS